MKTLTIAIALVASPVFCLPAGAQSRLTPKGTAAPVDNCAPIGRTANRELVYSMKCENPPAPQAELKQAVPPPEPEVQRSGLFGMSYEVKRPDR